MTNLRKKQFVLISVLVITFVFMIVEAIVGLLANSLALLADAGHMLSDVFSLGLSVFAMILAGRPITSRFTFGYARAEILAALFNGSSLLVISILIIREALERLGDEPEVLGGPIIIAALAGLLVNIYGLVALRSHTHDNLNLRAAFLHIVADLLGSVAAILAGILILATGNPIWDIVVSVVITGLIMISGLRVVRKALTILMAATPENIDPDCIRTAMMKVDGVESVHDIHIWSIDQSMTMLSAHVMVEEAMCQHDRQQVMRTLSDNLMENHSIAHTTIQIEYPDGREEEQNCGC